MEPTIKELRGAFRYTIRCARCGRDFLVAGTIGKRKFCDRCRIERERERDRRYKLKKRAEERNENPNSRQNKKADKQEQRVSQIENIVSEARKAGISYGQYQALKSMGRL